MGNLAEAMQAYEHALRHNPQSIRAMNAISMVLRTREDFPKAAEYLQQVIKLDPNNGEAWGSLGKTIPFANWCRPYSQANMRVQGIVTS